MNPDDDDDDVPVALLNIWDTFRAPPGVVATVRNVENDIA
jgi:hypothetical protein